MSGHPHLEEAWWFGERIRPVLVRRGLWSPPAGYGLVVGEWHAVPFAATRQVYRPGTLLTVMRRDRGVAGDRAVQEPGAGGVAFVGQRFDVVIDGDDRVGAVGDGVRARGAAIRA